MFALDPDMIPFTAVPPPERIGGGAARCRGGDLFRGADSLERGSGHSICCNIAHSQTKPAHPTQKSHALQAPQRASETRGEGMSVASPERIILVHCSGRHRAQRARIFGRLVGCQVRARRLAGSTLSQTSVAPAGTANTRKAAAIIKASHGVCLPWWPRRGGHNTVPRPSRPGSFMRRNPRSRSSHHPSHHFASGGDLVVT